MPTTYKIQAYIICHDVRFGGYVSTTVETIKEPTDKEAALFLEPVIQNVLKQYQGEGYQYELSSLSIQLVANTLGSNLPSL